MTYPRMLTAIYSNLQEIYNSFLTKYVGQLNRHIKVHKDLINSKTICKSLVTYICSEACRIEIGIFWVTCILNPKLKKWPLSITMHVCMLRKAWCREWICIVFLDLTKAFYTVNRIAFLGDIEKARLFRKND